MIHLFNKSTCLTTTGACLQLANGYVKKLVSGQLSTNTILEN